MVFDKEMIEKIYAELPEKIEKIKSTLQRPLTLTEKILYAHLSADEVLKSHERAVDYVNRTQLPKWPCCNLCKQEKAKQPYPRPCMLIT